MWTFCSLADAFRMQSAKCNTQALHLPEHINALWVGYTTIQKGKIYGITMHAYTNYTSNKQLVHGYNKLKNKI